MRIHRFYISTPIDSDTFDVTDREIIYQWRSVFRYNVGSQVILFDGFGVDYLCIISSLRNTGATLTVVRKISNKSERKRDVWLCVGVIKKDNFDLVVQKATELGVTNVIPVLCERSEKKNLKIDRLQKIAIEASEQSGRSDLLKVHEIIDLKDLLDSDLLPNRAFFLHPEGESLENIINGGDSIAIFVGPEGGFSPIEEKIFKERNIIPITLGKQILRAETAAMAISSVMLI